MRADPVLWIAACLALNACASPLERAVADGRVDQLASLVAADKLRHCGRALGKAAARGQAEAAKTLIGAGCDVNAADGDGYTALMLAAQKGDEGLVRTLLEARADRDLQTWNGKTAAKLAREGGHKNTAAVIDLFHYSAAGAAVPAGPTGAEKAQALIDQLIRATKSIATPGERHNQAEAAADLIKLGAPAVPGLADAALGKGEANPTEVRRIAIRILGLMGPAAAGAIPALAKARKDSVLREDVTEALSRIKPK